tara:strand:- start:5181 stop:8213 length:3033 start_codon:yes stop_codon:yes gene_type:complete
MAKKTLAARNSALFGLNAAERKSGNYQNHSLIRNDWKSVDTLRDVYARVPTIIAGSSTTTSSVQQRAADSTSYNIPFGISNDMVDSLENAPLTQVLEDTDFAVVQSGSTDQVLFWKNSWNEATVSPNATTAGGKPLPGNVRSLLLKENEGTELEGVPYFSKYFHQLSSDTTGPMGMQPSEIRMAGSTEAVPPLMNGLLGTTIYDHYFKYDTYDKSDAQGEYNITLTPHYNYYLDSSPDYETEISSIPESMIPNYYMLEIAFSLGSEDTPSSYKNALSLDGRMDDTDRIIDREGTLTNVQDYDENNNELIPQLSDTQVQALSQGYFQYYVSNLSKFKSAVAPAYNDRYKNIAVLSEDLHNDVLGDYNLIARDDRGTGEATDDLLAISNYPFYNHINIPYNLQFTDGNINNAPGSIFRQLMNSTAGQNGPKFLTVLQLIAIDAYNGTFPLSSSSLPFNIYEQTPSNGGPLLSQNTSTDLYFNLEEVMKLLQQHVSQQGADVDLGTALYERILKIAALYNGEPLAEGEVSSNAVFIKSKEVIDFGFSLSAFVEQALVSTTFARRLLGKLEDWAREFYDLFVGTASPAASEAFMYVVEKRVIPPGQTSVPNDDPSTVVQTLFFGKDIRETERGINYYDTQIKYGVKYQYDIKQVRLVIGNRYKYTYARTIANSGSVHQGRAVGNALGFYADEDVAITNTVSFQRRVSTAENTPRLQYLSEDGTTDFAEDTLEGHYIYKFRKGLGAKRNFAQLLDLDDQYERQIMVDYAATPAEQPWFHLNFDGRPFVSARPFFERIRLNPEAGDGFDGNPSGGFLGDQTPVQVEALGGPIEPAEPLEEGTTNMYYGNETSAVIDVASGYFMNTAFDIEDEPTLADEITYIYGFIGDSYKWDLVNADYNTEKNRTVAIFREALGNPTTTGATWAFALSLWLLSFPAGTARPSNGLGNLATRGDALMAIWHEIGMAWHSSGAHTASHPLGDFACKLEERLGVPDSTLEAAFASYGVVARPNACGGN